MKIKLLTIAISLATLFSCQQKKMKNNLLPGISGKAGEVMVIMNKYEWDGENGRFINNLLLQDVPALPQSEPLFNPVNISLKAFSELFRIHRNIIIAEIDDEITKNTFVVSYDVWARPQIVIKATAKSSSDLSAMLKENESKILGLLLKAERDRLMNNYRKYSEQSIIETLRIKMGVNLTVPKGYSYDLDTTNFIWLSHEPPEVSQGIFIYRYPFTDDSTFTKSYLINKRNEFLEKYVGGEGRGTYMTTETQVPATFKSYMWKDEYTAELRGLWKVEGDFMGGPFVSLSRVNPKDNMVYTIEGFVYAPRYDKRNYIRQLEAILYSFGFDNEEQASK